LTAIDAPEEAGLKRRVAPQQRPLRKVMDSRGCGSLITKILDRLKAELEQLRAERDQLLDRLARLQAEFENARKRA